MTPEKYSLNELPQDVQEALRKKGLTSIGGLRRALGYSSGYQAIIWTMLKDGTGTLIRGRRWSVVALRTAQCLGVRPEDLFHTAPHPSEPLPTRGEKITFVVSVDEWNTLVRIAAKQLRGAKRRAYLDYSIIDPSSKSVAASKRMAIRGDRRRRDLLNAARETLTAIASER